MRTTRIFRAMVLSAALALTADAHSGEPLQPHDLWTAWTFEWGVVVPLIALALLYARGARKYRGFSTWDQASFWWGWGTLTLALVSPLHPLGEALFSAHMAQHEIIMTVSAPLLVLGRPGLAILWALPAQWRWSSGRLLKNRAVQRGWAFLVAPVAAWLIHAVVLWGWHIPALFNQTLESDAVHALQHISFLLAAVLYWWSLVQAHGARGYGSSVLSLFTTAIHTVLLGALLTLVSQPLYEGYLSRTQAWGLTALEDQQLGGLIMWVPAGIVYVGAGLALLYLWLQRSDRRSLLVSLAAVCVISTVASSCSSQKDVKSTAERLAGGKSDRGADKIAYYGCGSCHTIPGIAGANALVGPPLTGVADRVYVAGVLPNTPDNLVRWIQDPKKIDEKTAMPDLHVTESDARDITAYLLTLR